MKRALVVWGGWKGHDPQACAELVERLLAPEGFSVAISDTLDSLLDARSMDLVVPIWTMGTISEAQEKALVEAVQGGVGLGGFHGGMGDAFRAATSYQWVVGGQFVSHPDGITDYAVRLVNREDPITRGLNDFKVRTEQYYMHVDPSNEVLATTTFQTKSAPWVNGVVMPVAWKRRFGEGRVFFISVGHSPADFDGVDPRELLRRGLLWASR